MGRRGGWLGTWGPARRRRALAVRHGTPVLCLRPAPVRPSAPAAPSDGVPPP